MLIFLMEPIFCVNFLVVITYIMNGLGITAGAHRLWSHRAYRARLPLRILLGLFNSMAFQVYIHAVLNETRILNLIGMACGGCSI